MTHEFFMHEALKLAQLSASLGEVPVGAVVVIDNQIIGRGYNQRELKSCVLEHAELNAIKQASMSLGQWRLINATIYSTLEPCVMCAGAMLHARVKKLVYGAANHKYGGSELINQSLECINGVLADESIDLLQKFFQKLRL